MMKRFKLARKFTLILLLVFILGSVVGGTVLSTLLQSRAEARVTSEGVMLMQSMRAVRRYTDEQVGPRLESFMGSDEFWPETIPAYSARRVFERLHEQEGHTQADFHHIYKEAVLNPTNADDQADAFETALTADFRQDPSLTELSGFRQLPDRGLMFYSALPIAIHEESCLRCHSVPDVAPPSMVAHYGRTGGFGWELGSIIGSQVVYVPAEEVFQTAHRDFSAVISIFFGVFAIALLCLNFLLKPLVIQPVQYLARISQKLADDDIHSDADIQSIEAQKLATVVKREDELGQLGRIFQTMVNEVVHRQQRLQQQIRALKIEIDEKRKAKEVKEIVETDYFQSLRDKAKAIRNRHQTHDYESSIESSVTNRHRSP